ncbi:unnamed protein product [Kuraishia capsulata CBS 1993]|uniref:FACT complex subunit POB3 n=1 Tax=Kuraishia capsulata CBS 1993 TaxID=1382522 RepID=W6MIG4_9ASCO|nr:uncharacterized protein KUCA_T00000102001 [Kuraishia capsulata CBS 1993]CDK24142.1 unnamed protein product [Kuraishia capsulata CBS 1993]
MSSVEFEKIYLNSSRTSGKFRLADFGLGWKAGPTPNAPNVKNTPFLLPSEEILTANWSRGSRGWELRVYTKNRGVAMLDGFDQQDFNSLKSELQRTFSIQLEVKEHSLRGWNWGKTQLARNELLFNVNNRPAFEIPYSEIGNSNLTGKNEVAVELNLATKDDEITKAGDELVEVRFYVPGNVELEDEDVMEDSEVKSAASAFYDQLKDKADIGQVSGEAVVSFSDTLFLTPRGRYDIDMYPTSLRLRGKTYDYKIQYKQIQRIFSLPKADEVHNLIILQCDPPLRQGQTRYPYLTIQFAKDEETEVELNLSEEEFTTKYADKLKKKYDAQTNIVMASCFRGLTDRRVISAGSFVSKFQQAAISCSLKASEGHLYPLEKSFLFVTKPTVFIPFSEVQTIVMSRVGTSATSSRTFDMEVVLRGSGGTHNFGNISREEQPGIEEYCKSKGLKVRNDEKEALELMDAALDEDDSDDEDVVMRGSADEDGESVDEDFSGDSDSDPAEEFDSDASLSGSEDDETPDKKKQKT